MTDLTQFRIGQFVTLADSSAIMVIDGFTRQNNEEYRATVHFACDTLRNTTMSLPISELHPVLTPGEGASDVATYH